jgi:hypothetical protein
MAEPYQQLYTPMIEREPHKPDHLASSYLRLGFDR